MAVISKTPKPDSLSLVGASHMAIELRDWWAGKGYDTARFWAESIPCPDDPDVSSVYGVRSNLVNGQPPGAF